MLLGIIGAVRNNNVGIAGIAGGDASISNYGSEIWQLDVSSNGFNVIASNAAEALLKGCVDVGNSTFPYPGFGLGLHVMNNSWGGPLGSIAVENQVYNCWRNQVTLTASKGNSNSVTPVPSATFPADYIEDWLISVGGSGNNGSWVSGFNGSNQAWQANFGNHIDVVAPATEDIVMSTIRNPSDFNPPLPQPYCANLFPEYGCFNGLSAATPHVSGSAALMLSQHNTVTASPQNLSPEDVERILEKTATDVGPPSEDQWNGYGRINVGKALEQISTPYEVVHPTGLPVNTTQQQGPTQQVLLYPQNSGLAPTTYNAYPVVVTHDYIVQYTPNTNILDYWSRPSSTIGIGDAQSGQLREWADQTITSATVNGNQISLSIETRCWFVIDDLNNTPINQWVPAPPNNAQTAFSLHLNTTEAVGFSDAGMTDHNYLSLYPNPAEEQLQVVIPQNVMGAFSVELIDALGKVITSDHKNKGNSSILALNISSLSSGRYLLRLKSPQGLFTDSFLKL